MIRQPDFISNSYFNDMLELAKNKKSQLLLDKIKFKKSTEGRCIHMMHIGSFDNETISFSKMGEYAKGKGLICKSKIHREIYISDFRKVPTEKLKTILRFQLEN